MDTQNYTEETPRNFRRDMSYERLMVSGTFPIVGDPERHKQRLSAPFRFPFYDKDHLTHGHFSKGKEQTLRRDGIPDAVQFPVRELSLT